ncbi:kinase-like domain-containing protein [Peziza echinospora]|nr:kinase-like domain-containing protein [Peziza echinospora]
MPNTYFDTTPPLTDCPDRHVRRYAEEIEASAELKYSDGEVLGPNKRIYPRAALRRILTADVVTGILGHACPNYCDLCRAVTRRGNRRAWHKVARLHHIPGWTRKIVGPVDKYGEDGPPETETAISLFAMLVVIHRPLLVVGFLDRGVNDYTFVRSLAESWHYSPKLLDFYWPDLLPHEDDLANTAKTKIEGNIWGFAVPRIAVDGLVVPATRFLHQRLLPLMLGRRLGRGSTADVYEATILAGYGEFSDELQRGRPRPLEDGPRHVYALKIMRVDDSGGDWEDPRGSGTAYDGSRHREQAAVRVGPEADLLKEMENLQQVCNLRHRNIIEIFAALLRVKTHGESPAGAARPQFSAGAERFQEYQLLMPRMEHNLETLLKAFDAPEAGKERNLRGSDAVLKGQFYGELAGVADALNLMVNGPLRMSRCDIKPENILVCRDDSIGRGGVRGIRLKLTDFGHARLLRPAGSLTRTTRGVTFAGRFTDAYAPPEAHRALDKRMPAGWPEETDPLRTYDVWSLGCVLARVLSFFAWGPAGPALLNRALRYSIDPSSEDMRFFYDNGRDEGRPFGAVCLKRPVKCFLQALAADDRAGLDAKLSEFEAEAIDGRSRSTLAPPQPIGPADLRQYAAAKEYAGFMEANVGLVDQMLRGNPLERPQFGRIHGEMLAHSRTWASILTAMEVEDVAAYAAENYLRAFGCP